MTLIVFTTGRNRADIITDTWRYAPRGQTIERATKVHPIHHLDMAWTSQGDCEFATRWGLLVDDLAAAAADFDDFTAKAPDYARALWEAFVNDTGRTPEFVLFLIGFTTQQGGRFTAYQLAADFGFEPERIDEPFALPASPSYAMSRLEAHRIRRVLTDSPEWADVDTPQQEAFLDQWQQKPPMPAPSGQASWVNLAQHLRESRAEIESGGVFKVWIGGDLFHTILRQGETTTRRVHTFNDHGDGYLRLISGTLHPTGQIAPCPCGSGARYVDCCLRPYLDQPCECGSGAALQDCCSVLAGQVRETARADVPA